MRGYCGIGIYSPKMNVNVGGLFRSAMAFGADFMFIVGRRYTRQNTDTVAAYKHLPLFEYNSMKDFIIPKESKLIGVETGGKRNLFNFTHPERAIYILGAEDRGLSEEVLEKCDYTLQIPTSLCLNVANAGTVVLYDRAKQNAIR